MKNIGTLVKKHGIKPIINVLYLIPVFLLLVGIVLIGVSMFKAPATERTYYYIGMVLLLLLIIILLVAKSAYLPKYYFELYENGVKVIFKKEKTPNEEFLFEEITEIWKSAIGGGKKANYLAFKSAESDYQLISPKFSDYKSLIHQLNDGVLQKDFPVKSAAIIKGERLSFSMLPAGGDQVVLSEKAILTYLRQSKKEHISLDRFSLFDGQKTYSLTDISRVVNDNASGNIVVNSIAGSAIYTQSYFSICNADLLLRLLDEVIASRSEPSLKES